MMRVFAGHLPLRDASEAIADERLTITSGDLERRSVVSPRSAYSKMFVDGATLYPRMLCLVERKVQGRLGASTSRPFVQSRRNSQEKTPWKNLDGLEQAVEIEFLRTVYLGESILPFRVWHAFEGVIPVNAEGAVMSSDAASDFGLAGLGAWMRSAERCWDTNKRTPLTLAQQFDFYGKLTAQFPIAPLRVVYSKAGTHPAACILRDAAGIIDHKLYWATPENEDEAYYLTAILNAEEARRRVETLQSRGLFGARDFDKVMFTLPIPRFSAASALHADLAAAGREAETTAASFEISGATPFARARRMVRDGLRTHCVSDRIDALVGRLLDG